MEIQAKRFSPLLIVAVVCILVCFCTAIYPNFNTGSIGQMVFGATIFTPVLAIPFVVLWYLGRKAQTQLIRSIFIVAMFAALGWWCFVFWESFLVPENSDPQNALIFFFGPLYSSIAAAIIGNVLVWLDARMPMPR